MFAQPPRLHQEEILIFFPFSPRQKPFGGFKTYYEWLAHRYVEKRDLLVQALKAGGLRPMVPQGAFFVMANTSGMFAVLACLAVSWTRWRRAFASFHV